MPRSAKLSRHKGYWYTRAGKRSGVFFGKVGDVPYTEAKKRFRKYLATLDDKRKIVPLTKVSVGEVCDAHLEWVEKHRSHGTYTQRRSILSHFCNHVVGDYDGERLPGHGRQIADLLASSLNRLHIEQYRDYREATPSEKTNKPIGDKALRALIVAIKACWNWAARSKYDGGGGFLADDHRPLASLPRGFIEAKDLTEADLPTDEEIEVLIRWGAVEPAMVRTESGGWRKRLPDEYYTNDSRTFSDMLRVYHAAGPRTSELCIAEVRDFMPRTSQLCLGKHKRSRTQSSPSIRAIQVGQHIVDILTKHARGKMPNDPLFSHEDGMPWNMDQVTKRLKKVITLATEHDQPVRSHITPYSFRHLYISELLMIGTEPFKVAKMAGTSLREIERTYGHFFNEDLATAQAELEKARRRRQRKAAKQTK